MLFTGGWSLCSLWIEGTNGTSMNLKKTSGTWSVFLKREDSDQEQSRKKEGYERLCKENPSCADCGLKGMSQTISVLHPAAPCTPPRRIAKNTVIRTTLGQRNTRSSAMPGVFRNTSGVWVCCEGIGGTGSSRLSSRWKSVTQLLSERLKLASSSQNLSNKKVNFFLEHDLGPSHSKPTSTHPL